MESTLGKRITANRKRLGLTQDQLAEKLGITAQAVSKWENDLSCPDITMLPKLADIFDISIDTLLGRDRPLPVCETEVVTEATEPESVISDDYGSEKRDFHWEGIKLEGISLAVWVLVTGILYLLEQFLPFEISIWNILWPSFMLVFGLFGIYPKLSVFRVGCGLFGGYILLCKFHLIRDTFDSGVVVAIGIVLFGLGLLAEALRKKSRRRHTYRDKRGHIHSGEIVHEYTVDGDHFSYDACFGGQEQPVAIELLRCGNISTAFGEYTVDLRGVATVSSDCTVNADCAFGELTILVPRHYTVMSDSSTSFASMEILGQPDKNPVGSIRLVADVSFGSICIRYI